MKKNGIIYFSCLCSCLTFRCSLFTPKAAILSERIAKPIDRNSIGTNTVQIILKPTENIIQTPFVTADFQSRKKPHPKTQLSCQVFSRLLQSPNQNGGKSLFSAIFIHLDTYRHSRSDCHFATYSGPPQTDSYRSTQSARDHSKAFDYPFYSVRNTFTDLYEDFGNDSNFTSDIFPHSGNSDKTFFDGNKSDRTNRNIHRNPDRIRDSPKNNSAFSFTDRCGNRNRYSDRNEGFRKTDRNSDSGDFHHSDHCL